MIRSSVHRYSFEDGAVQRVQKVCLESWDGLRFLRPEPSPDAFAKLCSLYGEYIIKKYAKIFGKVVLFRIPPGTKIPFPVEDPEYGRIVDACTAVSAAFRKEIRCERGKLIFRDAAVRAFYEELKQKGCLYLAEGERSSVSILPVGEELGFLSRSCPDAQLKVNASFFVMDILDVATAYDRIGVPIGLCVRDGEILNPPLFDREALLVDGAGKVSVRKLSLSEISVEIGGVRYRDGENAVFCTRPKRKRTPKGGFDWIVVGNRVVAFRSGGDTLIPSGGFAVHLDRSPDSTADRKVRYSGMEEIRFGIQVGNSVAVDGVRTAGFVSPFYNFLQFWKPSYPPSFYPLNYKKSRAPRIVLGADSADMPVLLWFEGAGKFGYEAGKDSSGVSLSEAADICADLGIRNGVHLDGGGSAQILIGNSRELLISDRDPSDLSEQERAVSMGLFVP